jgi:hypothetical protein
MTTKKKRKVIVKKFVKIAPDVHEVAMEVHGAPDPPIPLPLNEPLELEDFNDYNAGPAPAPPKRGFWAWLFGTENDG